MALRQEIQRRSTEREARHKLTRLFPDSGPLRRELYARHLEFFAAGKEHRERLFMAANRVGKTEGAGGYETALHLTGQYPKWWEGRRFTNAIQGWTAGDTSKTVRDIQQEKLLGPVSAIGTGLIPADTIIRHTPKTGVPDAIETLYVRHESGGESRLDFKSYDQGRIAFQGTSKHLIWLDEEPDMGVYTECLTRTLDCGGIVMLTFTPLRGLSEVVLAFMPDGTVPG